MYIQQKLSTYKIAEIYKCHPAQIGVLLRKHGIRIRSKQQAMFIDRGVNITKSELHRLYIKGDLSTHEIAKRLSIAYWLKKGRSYTNIKQNLKVSSATIASTQSLLNKTGVLLAIKKIEAEEWASVWAEKIKKFVNR